MSTGNRIISTLEERLQVLRVADLHEIRKNLQVKNASSLKKNDLINKIMTDLPELMDDLLLKFDTERLEIVTQLIKNDGVLDASSLIASKLDYLVKFGVMYMDELGGRRILSIPTSLLAVLEEKVAKEGIQTAIKQNTEIIQVTRGLLYYYGILPKETLYRLIKTYTQDHLYSIEYDQIIDSASEYYGETIEWKDDYSFIAVLNPEQIKKEQDEQSNVDYYSFTKAQILEAGQSDFIEQPKGYHQLFQLIKENHHMKDEQIEMLLKLLVMRVKNGQKPSDILQEVQRDVKFNNYDEAQVFMEYLIELIHHTRQWGLKGFQIAEKNQEKTVVQQQKVGRNDPCPCGSGKKYKKCCGR